MEQVVYILFLTFGSLLVYFTPKRSVGPLLSFKQSRIEQDLTQFALTEQKKSDDKLST